MSLEGGAVIQRPGYFGTGLLYLDGVDSYVTETPAAGYGFENNESFSVEFWVKAEYGVSRYLPIWSQYVAEDIYKGGCTIWADTDTNQINYTANGQNIHLYALNFPMSTWTHVTLCHNGVDGAYYFFINGTLKDTGSSGSPSYLTEWPLFLGKSATPGTATNNFFKGYIDNFRLSKGIVRHTTSFSVPTAPLESDAYTTYLNDWEGIPIDIDVTMSESITFSDSWGVYDSIGTMNETVTIQDLMSYEWSAARPAYILLNNNMTGGLTI